MILEKQNAAIILSSSEDKSNTTEMSLDKNSEQFIMQMFSESLYSDSVGSVIREWTSNGIDSARRAKTDVPVIVALKQDENNNYEFTVEDFGTGLSAYEVDTVISQYGNSTKRTLSTELGGFGIGFKSGLSYNSVFYFVCRKDGIENKYMMYKGEFKNSIDLLYTSETSEKNGVKMIIPVQKEDVQTFIYKIKEQLCYFENVYFDVENNKDINNFKIARDFNYQNSTLCIDDFLHITLDDVYYPLDYKKLGISQIAVPIALRFNLSSGIYPTPNRESIILNTKTKEIILEKLSKVSNKLIKEYNEKVLKLKTYQKLVNYCENTKNLCNINNLPYKLDDLEKHSKYDFLIPNLESFKYLDFVRLYNINKYYLLKEFQVTHILKDDCIRKPSKNWDEFLLRKIVKNNTKIYYLDRPITFKQKQYIRDTNTNAIFIKDSHLIRKLRNEFWKSDTESYYQLLNLNLYKKEIWRDVIKEFQSFIEEFKNSCTKISDVVVPTDFIEKIKSERVLVRKKAKKIEGIISTKIAVAYVHDYNQCKFVESSYNLQNIPKTNVFLVYSRKENLEKIKKAFNVYRSVNFIIVSQKDFEILNKLNYHNCMNIEKFEEGSSKHFKKVATSLLIEKLINNNDELFSNLSHIKDTSEILFTSLLNLQRYSDKYLSRTYISYELKNAIIATASENNLFDTIMYSYYKEIDVKLKSLDFLNTYFSIVKNYVDDKKCTEILNMLFKYKKQRINLENYNIKNKNNENT